MFFLKVFGVAEIKMVIRAGKLLMPGNYEMNTCIILGLKPRSRKMVLQIKSNGLTAKSAQWERNKGWTIDANINADNMESNTITDSPPITEVCSNCSGYHNIKNCNLPSYTMHCSHCLVVSLDGAMHGPPCKPVNRKSSVRLDLLAKRAITLFQLSYNINEANVFHLNDSRFVQVSPQLRLISAPVEGLLKVRNNDNEQFIGFKQTQFNRCSFLIAVLDGKGIWRLRFRLVVTPVHGLAVFKLSKTLNVNHGRIEMPNDLMVNTVAVFGVAPIESSFYITLRVHANESGRLSSTQFDGYIGYIGVEVSEANIECFIDDALNGNTNQLQRKRFNNCLYRREEQPLSTFQSQRTAPVINR